MGRVFRKPKPPPRNEKLEAQLAAARKREEERKKIAIFNKFKKLELGISKSNPKTYGSAHTLFGLNYSDTVTVIFE